MQINVSPKHNIRTSSYLTYTQESTIRIKQIKTINLIQYNFNSHDFFIVDFTKPCPRAALVFLNLLFPSQTRPDQTKIFTYPLLYFFLYLFNHNTYWD